MRVSYRKKTHRNQVSTTQGRLVPHYTFDSFVVGNCNSLAHASALDMANNQAESYTPLFIHGGCGLGKTHLLHAIGNHIQQNTSQARIRSCRADTFMDEYINSIRSGRRFEFSKHCRSADILLFDNLQFLGGKEATQVEFLQLFEALFQAGKRIVIAASLPHKKLIGFDEYLLSRFEGSLVVEILPPDFDTRLAILKIKAASLNISAPGDVLQFLAATDFGNVRAMEGILIKLGAYCRLNRVPISLDMAREVAEDWNR